MKPMAEDVILKLDGMYKSFGATKAVQNVSMELHKGQVLALIGENGSGKSTLMSLVSGSQKADVGTMTYLGEEYIPRSLIDAGNRHICILIQETGTISGLSVAENIFLGKESRFGTGPIIRVRKMNKAAQELLDRVGAGERIKASAMVDDLSFEDRKLVEVCRALSNNPEVLIVDETTTALSHTGRDKIYEIIKTLKDDGKGVIFISHDLEEVQKICDSALIMRDGLYIDTLYGEEVTPDKMRQKMIGRDLTGSYYRDEKVFATDEVVLEVKNINWANRLHNISFTLHKGEILGLGGLTECGMHELCKVVFGDIRPDSGEVILTKDKCKITSTMQAIRHHMAYLPKDRDTESLFLYTSIQDNITVTSFDDIKKGLFIWPKDEKALAEKAAAELAIKMQSVSQEARELSGGNKQKVVVAKWLANDSQILIMDCPTRGIDIGVKATIYQLMETLISEGKSIIMVSEEIPELLGMSDRILIMKDGVLNGQFAREDNLTESMLIEKVI